MKFKHKTEIKYTCVLIYSCLILDVYAARPFSTGRSSSDSKSNFGSTSRNQGFSKSNTASYSRPSNPIISIADSKAALRSSHNMPDFGFGFTNKQTAYNPSLNIAKRFIGSPTRQPPYNPFYIAVTNTLVSTKVNTLPQKPVVTKNGSVSMPKINTLLKQPAYNPFYNSEMKYQTSSVIKTTLKPWQPASNHFYNPQPKIPPVKLFSNTQHFKNLNTSRNNTKNITDANKTFEASPLDYINSYPYFKALNLKLKNDSNEITNKVPSKCHFKHVQDLKNTLTKNRALSHHSILGVLGYTAPTIHRHHIFKSQQDINRELQNQKPNHQNSIIIIASIIAFIIAILGVAIYFFKSKK